MKVELAILARESVTGAKHDERVTEKTTELKVAEAKLVELEKRWESEKGLVQKIMALRTEVEKAHGESGDLTTLRPDLDAQALGARVGSKERAP